MAWSSITFTIGQILTSAQVNTVQENARQARINHYGGSTPADLEVGVMWWDTTGTYPTLKLYSGSLWVPVLFYDPARSDTGLAPHTADWGMVPMVDQLGERTNFTGPLYFPKNMLLNGAMNYWQRGNSYQVKSYRNYTADRWMVDARGSFTVNVRQSSFNPLTSPSRYCFELQIAVPQVTLNSGNLLSIAQPIEGTMMYRTLYGTSEARKVAVGAHLWSNVTGRFSIAICNASRNSTNVQVVTYSVASVWQYVSAALDPPVSSNWATDTGVGAWVAFTFAAHDSFRTSTPNNWVYSSPDVRCVSGQLQGASTSGTIFRITDFQLELGQRITPFDTLQPAAEIALLRRYYTKTFALEDPPRHGTGGDNFESALGTITENGAHTMITWQYPGMRATPTITFYCPGNFNGGAWWDRSDGSAGRWAQQYHTGPDSAIISTQNSFASGVLADHDFNRHLIHATADAELF